MFHKRQFFNISYDRKIFFVSSHDGKAKICQFCGACFKHKGSLKRHVESNHAEKGQVRTYECSNCNTAFRQKGNLKRHMELVHNKGKEGLILKQWYWKPLNKLLDITR